MGIISTIMLILFVIFIIICVVIYFMFKSALEWATLKFKILFGTPQDPNIDIPLNKKVINSYLGINITKISSDLNNILDKLNINISPPNVVLATQEISTQLRATPTTTVFASKTIIEKKAIITSTYASISTLVPFINILLTGANILLEIPNSVEAVDKSFTTLYTLIEYSSYISKLSEYIDDILITSNISDDIIFANDMKDKLKLVYSNLTQTRLNFRNKLAKYLVDNKFVLKESDIPIILPIDSSLFPFAGSYKIPTFDNKSGYPSKSTINIEVTGTTYRVSYTTFIGIIDATISNGVLSVVNGSTTDTFTIVNDRVILNKNTSKETTLVKTYSFI